MLRRPSRLPREGFRAITLGKRLVAPHFSISYGKGVGAASPGQAAVVVSKKVARTSVARHLLKRRVMDIASPRTGKGVSFIVYARKGATELSFKAIKAELEPLFDTLAV